MKKKYLSIINQLKPGDHAFTTLVFYVEDVDGQRDTIWKLTTRDVNDWEEGQIPLNFGYDYNVSTIFFFI